MPAPNRAWMSIVRTIPRCDSATPRRSAIPPFSRRSRATEDAGYDSFVVPDSVIFPAESDTRYPYTPDGDRAFLEDKPIIEPFTLIPFLAAQTTRLRFTTFVAEARDPAARPRRQAGREHRGAERRPAPPRRGHQPVARRLRRAGPAVGAPRRADGRDDRHRPRAHRRRLVRVPRRGARPRAVQDQPDTRAADPDPRRWALGSRAAARGAPRRRLDPRGRRRRPSSSRCSRA